MPPVFYYALSIKQPWAYVICEGVKLIENRDWYRDVEGFRLIHTGKSYDHDAEDFIIETYLRLGLVPPTIATLRSAPRGAIVGSMDIAGYTTPDQITGPQALWAFGTYCFVLRSAQHLATPIPYRGELGFFRVPADLDGLQTQLQAA